MGHTYDTPPSFTSPAEPSENDDAGTEGQGSQ